METKIPCFVCGKVLESAFTKDVEYAPYGGTIFISPGNYGSTVFDDIGRSYLMIIICDEHLLEKREVILRCIDLEVETVSEPWKPYEED